MWPYIVLIFITWFSSFLKYQNPLRYFLFFVPTMLIVGFRYEVGFDWPVYTRQFEQFQSIDITEFFPKLSAFVLLYAQEPLFLITSFFAAQIFPVYEIFQFFVYFLFIISIIVLGKAIGSRNIIGAMVPIHMFLLFTLEFSTIRQSIAISFFNIGLAYYLNRSRSIAILYQGAAIFTQSSTILYLLVQLWNSSVTKWSRVAILFTSGIAIFLSAGGLELIPVSLLPGFLSQKLDYYMFNRGYNYSIYEQLFFLALFGSIAIIFRRPSNSFNPKIQYLADMVVFLCLFAFMAFWVNTIRNRLMYEIIILSSLISYGPSFKMQRTLQLLLLSSSLIFFIVSVTKSTSFVYIPYQNYLWYKANDIKSDGLYRNDRLRQYLINSR